MFLSQCFRLGDGRREVPSLATGKNHEVEREGALSEANILWDELALLPVEKLRCPGRSMSKATGQECRSSQIRRVMQNDARSNKVTETSAMHVLEISNKLNIMIEAQMLAYAVSTRLQMLLHVLDLQYLSIGLMSPRLSGKGLSEDN